MPNFVSLLNKELNLHSVTLWNGSHYICILKHNNVWYTYDGLKEGRQANTGLSVFNGQQNGYSLSNSFYLL